MILRELAQALTEELNADYTVAGDSSRPIAGLGIDEPTGNWLDIEEAAVTGRESLEPEFLQYISKKGAPVLIWRTGSAPAPEVTQYLQQSGMGLLLLPLEIPLSKLINVFLEQDVLLRHSHRTSKALLESTGGEASIKAVALRIAELLGHPIAVEDSVGRLLTGGGESEDLLYLLEQRGIRASRRSGVEDTQRERRDRYARLSDGLLSVPVEYWRVARRELLWVPVGKGTPVGYLWVDMGGQDLNPEDIVLLYWARRILEAELGKERVRLETALSVRGDFVDDLINNRYGSAELLLQRAGYLGADLSQGALVLIVDIDDFARYLSFRKLKEPAVQDLKKRLADAVHLQARELFTNYLLGLKSDNVILFLAPTETLTPEALPAQAQRLAEQVQRYTRGLFPDLTVSVGIGRYSRDPDQLPDAYSEAEVALEIGRRIHGPASISTFGTAGTYKLLFRVLKDEPEELMAFYKETVAPIVLYDSRYGTELVGTLVTYLKNNASTAKTAAELFAHRHTIRYRLDRVQELTLLDVDKSEDRERLTLGIKAMQLLGLSPERPSNFTDR